ncbi:MAG: alpha-amylase family protein [Candidatus Krumholzibacteriia bacterium]
MAIVDYRTGDLDTPEAAARYAQADLVVLESSYLWSRPQNAGFVANVKALNPNARVLGYVLANTAWATWGDEPDSDPTTNPYGWDWYNATRPYWCYTTTGDTLMNWPHQVVLDILDPACRRAMIDVLLKWRREGSNPVDGFYWDYFSTSLWIAPAAAATLDGEPDLDDDGIGHFEDADERQAFRDAQTALVQETRAAFGDAFIQIFNGGRAAVDSTFAALGDGMFYELFPTVGFWGGPRMALALDPAQPNNLYAARRWPRTRNGGPWLVLSNPTPVSWWDADGQLVQFNLGEINRAVALLTGATACYHEPPALGYGWPAYEPALGLPLGGVVCRGDTLTRDFAGGRVKVIKRNMDSVLPFDFEITETDSVVQALRYPDYYCR